VHGDGTPFVPRVSTGGCTSLLWRIQWTRSYLLAIVAHKFRRMKGQWKQTIRERVCGYSPLVPYIAPHLVPRPVSTASNGVSAPAGTFIFRHPVPLYLSDSRRPEYMRNSTSDWLALVPGWNATPVSSHGGSLVARPQIQFTRGRSVEGPRS